MKEKSEIIELIKDVRGIEIAKSHYKNILQELKDIYALKSEYEELLEIRIEKISKSESVNLKSVFNRLVGRHAEILELQKQEYLRVTLEYNDVIKSINILEDEKKAVEEKIDQELAVYSKLKSTLIQIEVDLEDSTIEEFKRIYKELEHQSNLLRELEEAIKVSEQCIDLINETEHYLSLGEPIGNLAGISIEMILDEENFDMEFLQELISKIKFKLQEFEEEMSDLYDHLNLRTIEANKYSENFGKLFREVVLVDWQNNNSLYNSIEFLKKYRLNLEENNKILARDKNRVETNLEILEVRRLSLVKET